MLSRLSSSVLRQSVGARRVFAAVSVATRSLSVMTRPGAVTRTAHSALCKCTTCACAAKAVRFISQATGSTDKELAVTIQRQIADAAKQEPPASPDVPAGWKLVETAHKHAVVSEFTKTVGDDEITLRITLEPPVDSYPSDADMDRAFGGMGENENEEQSEQEQEQKENENKEEEEENPEEENPYTGLVHNFQIVVNKSKLNKAVLFECVSDSGRTFINRCVLLPSADVAHDLSAEGQVKRALSYNGPAIGDIDDALREHLLEFLERRGVNDDLAKFVMDYAVYQEASSYIKWLKDLKEFVRNK